MQGIAFTLYDDKDVSKVDVVSGTTFPSNVTIGVHVHAVERAGRSQVEEGLMMQGMLSRRGFGGLLAGACSCGTVRLFAGCGTSAQEGKANLGAGPMAESVVETTSYDQVSTTVFAFDTVVTLTASCSQKTLDDLAQRCQYFGRFSRVPSPRATLGA